MGTGKVDKSTCTPFTQVCDHSKKAMGQLATGAKNVAVSVGSEFAPVAKKVAKFIKNHWKQLIAYTLVWGLFITICGWKFGFEATALPITIGLACGLGAGAIAGIIIVRIDPKGEKLPVHTLWDGTNYVLKQIKDDGTRNFIWWAAAAGITAFSYFYPYILGAVVGLYVGNQIVVKILQERVLGPDPRKKEVKLSNLETRFKTWEKDGEKMKREMEELRKSIEQDKRKEN